jgi:peptide/nickel transport system substrate-binding protein
MTLSRRQLGALAGAAAGALPLAALPAAAQAETVLRVAMTLSDIPYLGGQTDQGGEGWRFAGCTLHETLVNWDVSQADRPTRLIPGLAQSWAADPADRRRWIFKLHQAARFHDGSRFDADALV